MPHTPPPDDPSMDQPGDPGYSPEDAERYSGGGSGEGFERDLQDHASFSRDAGSNWAVYGPADQLQEGKKVEVRRRDGSTTTVTVGPPVDSGGSSIPSGMALHGFTDDGPGSGFARSPQDRVTFSKDADGRWALYGPAALLAEGKPVEVHRRDGSSNVETPGPEANAGDAPLPEGMALRQIVRQYGR